MSAQHTPLPWACGRDGEVFSEPRYQSICQVLQANDEGDANAAFIVRAVNSHYELLEALEYALNSLGDPVPIGRRHVARKIQVAIAKTTATTESPRASTASTAGGSLVTASEAGGDMEIGE